MSTLHCVKISELLNSEEKSNQGSINTMDRRGVARNDAD
jgi:hypothetical protein